MWVDEMVNLSEFASVKVLRKRRTKLENSQTRGPCRLRSMAQLDQDRVLPRVGRETFYLQGLVPDPSEERVVRRGEFAEALGDVFVVMTAGAS